MSECSCIVVDDYDPPDFYQKQVVCARKAHKCCECERQIEPKEQYESATGKWESHLTCFKTCADCLSVRNALFCKGYLHGGMWETVWEHLFDLDGVIESTCLEGMTEAGRLQVIEKIDELWEDDDESDS